MGGEPAQGHPQIVQPAGPQVGPNRATDEGQIAGAAGVPAVGETASRRQGELHRGDDTRRLFSPALCWNGVGARPVIDRLGDEEKGQKTGAGPVGADVASHGSPVSHVSVGHAQSGLPQGFRNEARVGQALKADPRADYQAVLPALDSLGQKGGYGDRRYCPVLELGTQEIASPGQKTSVLFPPEKPQGFL